LNIGGPAGHRFPPPRTADETEACFIVKDQNGQALGHVYFEDERRRRTAANLLTRDEPTASLKCSGVRGAFSVFLLLPSA
jgi:hypothetical protein